ncbi:TIGR02679 family protein [Actinoalloteichus sp. GBA129-24]|uniref:TIGR02679 family protein n=1 Tax=Actinoalloteichus sp. GBA129-24 TaxID=1612551 RepID=UPI0009526DBE|nr:TIGR02679 family protein [Actinoalloteichus sp. GBA129-24]
MGARSRLSPELAPLWRALHDRLSSGRSVSRVRVGPLDDAQRNALADLLGMTRLPAEYTTVSLPLLDTLLRDAVGASVHEVVTELVGPVGDKAGDRQRAASERAEVWTWLKDHPTVVAQPALADWAATVRRSGLIAGSTDRTREILAQVLRVLAELPAPGVPRPVFAETVLRHTHALDDGTRTAGLVLRALAAIYDVEPPADAAERRALWERAGIADDELSSVVLAAGFRPAGDDVASRILRSCADAGHVAALTLAQIRAADWAVGPAEAWIFENPSVLALAITRFGMDCPPMVVTSGWPSSAGILLLRTLTAAGTRLSYHGDLDGEGLRIAAHVIARTGARPWRMTSADYLESVDDGPPVGRVTPAPWDDDLGEHLRRVGKTVSEERTAPVLLDELARHHGL